MAYLVVIQDNVVCWAKKNPFKLSYRSLVKMIKYLGERGIYEKTGCKSNCKINRYKLEKRIKLINYTDTNKVKYTVGGNWLLLYC